MMDAQRSKEESLTLIEEAAYSYEKSHHGCSRSALKALQDHLNLGNSLIFKASTPLAAGIAMRGETCGALLAGLLAVGMVTASEKMEDEKAFNDSMIAAFRLVRRFEKEFGSITCGELQKRRLGRAFNMADPDDYQEFIEAGGYVECPKLVGKAARLIAEFIWDLKEI
jgi:C_GCAxxG_C_C family probable redox protein